MTREELNFIGSMNLCDEISNEAYKKIVCHCREQEPCEDAISRQAVLDEISDYNNDLDYTTNELYDRIKRMPSVNAQPKTGHWIDIMVGDMPAQACDQCNTFYPLAYTGGGHKYCPNCGCRMVEPQESEG